MPEKKGRELNFPSNSADHFPKSANQEKKQGELPPPGDNEKDSEWYELLFHNVSEAIFVHRGAINEPMMARNFVDVNDAACRLLGYTRAELLLISPQDIDAQETVENMPSIWERLGRGKKAVWEGVYIHKDGRRIPVEIQARLFYQQGMRIILSTVKDISDRRNMAITLQASEEKYRDLFENANDGIMSVDQNYNFLEVNRIMEEMLEFSREELLKMNIFDIVPAEQKPHDIVRLSKFNNAALTDKSQSKAITKSGKILDVETSSSAILVDGKYAGLRCIIRDITERKRVEEALRDSEERYRKLVENLPDIVYSGSTESGGTYYSARVEEILGYPVQYIIDNPTLWKTLIHPDDQEKVYAAIENFSGGRLFEMEYRIKDRWGRLHWFLDRSINIQQKSDHENISSGLITDITERKRLEEEIRETSMRDQLTGLYNRRGFMALSEQQLKAAKRGKMPLILAFIDTDGLKRINDNLGHEEGDLSLKDAAEILRQTFRESDIVARIGGDEFAVLAIDTDYMSREKIAQRLQQNIDAFNAGELRRYKVAMSWGTARYDPESPLSVDQLMSTADGLMYAQKKAKNTTEIMPGS